MNYLGLVGVFQHVATGSQVRVQELHIWLAYTVLSVNDYTPFEKYNFKQYLNEHKKHFQNVDKTKFYITSV